MTEASSLHQLRRLILAIVLLGITGLVAELLFIEHFESWQQLVPIVSLALAFAVAIVAIRTFLKMLNKNGFRMFGIYRIVIGGVLLALLLAGKNISVV